MEMQPPPPFLIENANGRDISIEQFVTSLSEYATAMREQIFECEDRQEREWEGACLYVDYVGGPSRKEVGDPDVLFKVSLLSISTSHAEAIEKDSVRMEKKFVESPGEQP
jgi:hypothetical protein